MKKRIEILIWGICFMAFGAVIAGNTLNWWNLDLLFKGWWTLFLIIPCGIGVLLSGVVSGSFIGLFIGCLILLAERNSISYDHFWRLLIPGIIIFIGIQLIFRNFLGENTRENTGTKVLKYIISLFAAIASITAFLIFSASMPNQITSDKDSGEYVSFTESFEEISGLLLDTNYLAVNIKKGDRFEIEAIHVLKGYEIELKDDTLVFENKGESSFDIFNLNMLFKSRQAGMLNITIPEGAFLEEFTILAGSGRVQIEDIHIGKFIGDFGSGSAVLSGVFAKEARIDTGSGKVSIVSSSMKSVMLNSGSGMVSYEGELLGQCTIDSGSGNVAFLIKETLENYYISGDSGSGGIWINGEKQEEVSMGNQNSPNAIFIDGGSGRVVMEFEHR